jgi:hypothetical protein
MQKAVAGAHAEYARARLKPRYHLLIVRFDEQKIPFKIHPASRDRADALANLPSQARWSPRSGMWPFRQQNGISATHQLSSASNRRRVFHMKSDLAIAALIRSRMAKLGLSRGEFAKRLGYKNVAKGIRRVDVLCDGDVEGTKQFLDVLPQALEASPETVKLALDQTRNRNGREARSRSA